MAASMALAVDGRPRGSNAGARGPKIALNVHNITVYIHKIHLKKSIFNCILWLYIVSYSIAYHLKIS